MSFSTYAEHNKYPVRVLVEMDITEFNTQWVNIGAGIWCMNTDGTYDWVDSSLLDGFTSQDFAEISNVIVDYIDEITEVAALASIVPGSFYFDSAGNTLYICLDDYSDPHIHDITLGVVYHYATKDFQPVGNENFFEGRLHSDIQVSISREPMFFGRLAYNLGGITLHNADGEFDTFVETHAMYGNEVRILAGYDLLDYDDYINLAQLLIENANISSVEFSLGLVDKRKTLSKEVNFGCTETNALVAIRLLLEEAYGYSYTSYFYDTTTWAAAEALAPPVTIAYDDDTEDKYPVIDIIEEICKSIFGIFTINNDKKFTFRYIDYTSTVESVLTIPSTDILNIPEVSYDPSEVISSVKIGYDKSWATNDYTYKTYTDRESTVFKKYKVYNEQTFDTLLDYEADADDLAERIQDYFNEVHGTYEITVPIKYYDLEIGNAVTAELYRENNVSFLGDKLSEIIGKTYNLIENTISFTCRIV